MSNSKKLLERIKGSEKIPNDITVKEFLNLVNYLGFTTREGGRGSHTIIMGKTNGVSWHLTVATGHPGPIDPKAIKELKEKLID